MRKPIEPGQRRTLTGSVVDTWEDDKGTPIVALALDNLIDRSPIPSRRPDRPLEPGRPAHNLTRKDPKP